MTESQDIHSLIEEFLNSPRIAVAGASNDLAKVGAQVFAAYLNADFDVYPVNPTQSEIQGHKAYPSLTELPYPTAAVSVITPPRATLQIIEDAAQAGVEIVWLQPGSESPEVLQRAEALGLRVISGGACVLVSLRMRAYGG